MQYSCVFCPMTSSTIICQWTVKLQQFSVKSRLVNANRKVAPSTELFTAVLVCVTSIWINSSRFLRDIYIFFVRNYLNKIPRMDQQVAAEEVLVWTWWRSSPETWHFKLLFKDSKLTGFKIIQLVSSNFSKKIMIRGNTRINICSSAFLDQIRIQHKSRVLVRYLLL